MLLASKTVSSAGEPRYFGQGYGIAAEAEGDADVPNDNKQWSRFG